MTKIQYKILKYIYNEPKTLQNIASKFHLDENKLKIIFESDDDFYLFFNHKRNHDMPNNPLIFINNIGAGYVESKKSDSLRFWIPIIIDFIISTTALIISIIK